MSQREASSDHDGRSDDFPQVVTPEAIDRVIEENFLAPGADRREENLRFVRNRVADRGDITRRLLQVYQKCLKGLAPVDDPTSPIHNELKLSGLVKPRENGTLAVRNRIYARVFSPEWVRQVWPADRTFRIAVSAVVLLLLSLALYFEILYPRADISTLKTTRYEYTPAHDAYQRLRNIPFYGNLADKLWGDFGLRRANEGDRA